MTGVQPKTAKTGHAFLALDGLRGVAAIAVMVFHYSLHFLNMHGKYTPWLPNAPFAVDFFFVLSGFVIAYAYEGRLLAGEKIGRFMRRRLIRLYPLYFFGITLPLVIVTVHALWSHKILTSSLFSGSYFFSALFLPTPSFVLKAGELTPFPLNDAAWTLSLEIAVNLIYASICRGLTMRRLTVLLLLNATVLALAVWHYADPNMGWHWPTYMGGWARVMWEFFAGIFLYRLFHRKTSPSFPSWVGAILVSILLVIFICPGVDRLYSYFNYVIVLPAIVWIGARTSAWGEPARRLYTWLGQTSYAVYIVHMPLLPMYDLFFKNPHLDSRAQASIAIVTCATFSLAIVWALDAVYDIPVRAWLTKKSMRTDQPTSNQISMVK